MKITTFKFNIESDDGIGFHIPSATLSATRWARRRSFPIRVTSVTPRSVCVELEAPSNALHNRAVNALGKILSRQLDRRHFVLESRLVSTHEKHKPQTTKNMRTLNEIAREIRADWKKVNFAAKPYLDAMESPGTVSDIFGHDTGRTIALYFLANSGAWRGETAKRIKAELRSIERGVA